MISKHSTNYLITVDSTQLLDLFNRKKGKKVNLTDFYKIQKGIPPPLLYDGKPREHFTKSNPNNAQTKLMLDTLRQYADLQPIKVNTNTKYLINGIYSEPTLAVDKGYTKYLRPLILDSISKQFYAGLNPYLCYMIFTMTNNDIAYDINILGDMFHHKAYSKYDKSREMLNAFYDKYYDILLDGYTRYLFFKLNEDMSQKIRYSLDGLHETGLEKREIALTLNNERVNDLYFGDKSINLTDISANLINSIKGKNAFLLENSFNKEFADSISNIYSFYGAIPPPYENYKLAWEFTINEDFRIRDNGIDLDYCRKKLNLNIVHKFIQSNGLALFEEYKEKKSKGELPEYGADLSGLKKFYKNVQCNDIEKYVSDMLCVIENISV